MREQKDQAQPAPTPPKAEEPKPAPKKCWDDIPDFDACRDVDSAE
jgi:hypothetical protein